MTILDKFFNRKHIIINENQRVLAMYNGELLGIYGAGKHTLPNRHNGLELQTFDLSNSRFTSVYEKALFEKLPEVANKAFSVFQTGPQEVMIIERDGLIAYTLPPERKVTLWNDVDPWHETRINIVETPKVSPLLVSRLKQMKMNDLYTTFSIAENHVGLLTIDDVYTETLTQGVHHFWNVGKTVNVKLVDLRRQSLDVSAQEMLTKDRVTIRINLSADYKIIDPLLAVSSVKDYSDQLYRALQFAFRRVIGTMTLDELLERKIAVNDHTAESVRKKMAEIGIEVFEIELKDVILPGEMRDILNKVVTAQKEAEANVIRRREETNATRSLLNTAKVMAENPIMLRLKELEALETISGKVNQLTIHNGTEGLLNDVVQLRSK